VTTGTETEWLIVTTDYGSMRVFCARPEGEPKGGVVVLQEAFGVNDHIQDVAGRLAQRGWLAAAPDLFYRTGGGPVDYQDRERAMALIDDLGPEDLINDVRAVVEHLTEYAGTERSRIALIGFCFGGRAAFSAATGIPRLSSVVVFYGPGIVEGPHAVLDRAGAIDAPVLLHVGAEDPLIPADHVTAIVEAVRGAGGRIEEHVYPEAGHAFACDARPANFQEQAANAAWKRTHEFLDEQFGSS
jgi:dienelactone hydrolase